MKNNSFARFAREFFIFGVHVLFFIFVHIAAVLVQSRTRNDLFCSHVDDEKT